MRNIWYFFLICILGAMFANRDTLIPYYNEHIEPPISQFVTKVSACGIAQLFTCFEKHK